MRAPPPTTTGLGKPAPYCHAAPGHGARRSGAPGHRGQTFTATISVTIRSRRPRRRHPAAATSTTTGDPSPRGRPAPPRATPASCRYMLNGHSEPPRHQPTPPAPSPQPNDARSPSETEAACTGLSTDPPEWCDGRRMVHWLNDGPSPTWPTWPSSATTPARRPPRRRPPWPEHPTGPSASPVRRHTAARARDPPRELRWRGRAGGDTMGGEFVRRHNDGCSADA